MKKYGKWPWALLLLKSLDAAVTELFKCCVKRRTKNNAEGFSWRNRCFRFTLNRLSARLCQTGGNGKCRAAGTKKSAWSPMNLMDRRFLPLTKVVCGLFPTGIHETKPALSVNVWSSAPGDSGAGITRKCESFPFFLLFTLHLCSAVNKHSAVWF